MLERDAIESLQAWLKEREATTGRKMTGDTSIFINKRGDAVSVRWIEKSFSDLATRAGLQKKASGYCYINMKRSHLLRGLLVSTLVTCGVRDHVADQFIGHAPMNTYHKLGNYSDYLRDEYKKASKRLNIFSKVSQSLSETVTNEDLKRELAELKQKSFAIQQKGNVDKEIIGDETKRLETVTKNQDEKIRSLEDKLEKVLKLLEEKG